MVNPEWVPVKYVAKETMTAGGVVTEFFVGRRNWRDLEIRGQRGWPVGFRPKYSLAGSASRLTSASIPAGTMNRVLGTVGSNPLQGGTVQMIAMMVGAEDEIKFGQFLQSSCGAGIMRACEKWWFWYFSTSRSDKYGSMIQVNSVTRNKNPACPSQ